MAIKAYYIENPEESVPQSKLEALGVLHWKLDADNYEQEGKLAQIRKDRNYNYIDFVILSLFVKR